MDREQTTIRLPLELKEKLQKLADYKGVSLNELVMMSINEFISHQE